jgi:hypothetical protein
MVIFFSRETSGTYAGPEAGDHSIGKNVRNLKLIFRVFSVPFWD